MKQLARSVVYWPHIDKDIELDALFPSPAHVEQGKLAKKATKDQLRETSQFISRVTYLYAVGAPCYALYCGPKRNKKPRWVPAVVTKVRGSQNSTKTGA